MGDHKIPGRGVLTQLLLLAISILLPILVLMPWEQWFSGSVELAAAYAPLGSAAHPLGTDNLGRDLLVRVSSAVKSSVLPLWLSAVGAGLLGVMTGLFVCSRRYSLGVGRIFSMLGSIPLFLLVFAASVFFERTGLWVFVLPLIFFLSIRFFNVIQLSYLRDAKKAYWTAGQAVGADRSELIWRYGISSAWLPLLVHELAFSMAVVVSIEGALSYLGLGVAEPTASFGNMLSSHFDDYLRGRMWVLVVVASAFILTLSWPFVLLTVAKKYFWTPADTSSTLSH